MKMQKVSVPSPQSPAALKWEGRLRIPGLKIHKEKVEKRIGVRFESWKVDSISGRRRKKCEEMRKRKMNVCCLEEVRWIDQGARCFGVNGRRSVL